MATFAVPAPSFAGQQYQQQDTSEILAAIQKAFSLGWYKALPSIDRFDQTQVHPWSYKHGAQVLELARLNVRPSSAIYIAELNPQGGRFGGNGALPSVCKALGTLAAQRLAEGSHRLATKEESERCENEAREREALCAEMERNSPDSIKRRQELNLAPEVLAAIMRTMNQDQREQKSDWSGSPTQTNNTPTGSGAASDRGKQAEKGK